MATRGKGSKRLTKRQVRAKYTDARKQLRVLRKQGLVSDRAKINADKPSLRLRKKLEDYKGLFTGTEQAVRVPRSKAQEFASQGFRVVNNRVFVPTNPGETVVYRPSHYSRGRYVPESQIEALQPKGSPTEYLKRIIIPARLDNFAAFNKWLQRDPSRLQRLIPPGVRIGFTFFGYRSVETGDAQWLAQYLQHYQPLFDPDQEEEAFARLELWAFSDDMVWTQGHEDPDYVYPKARRTRVNATGRNEYSSRGSQPKMAMTNAERQARYRENLKSDPKEYRAFRFEDAERKRQYRINKKNAAKVDKGGAGS